MTLRIKETTLLKTLFAQMLNDKDKLNFTRIAEDFVELFWLLIVHVRHI